MFLATPSMHASLALLLERIISIARAVKIVQRASEADSQSCSIEISDTSGVLEHKWRASLKKLYYFY